MRCQSQEKYTVLEGVTVKFPGGLPEITLRLEVRSVTRLDNLKYKLGVKAINIKSKEQDILFRYIFKRQRELVAASKGAL